MSDLNNFFNGFISIILRMSITSSCEKNDTLRSGMQKTD